MIARIGLVLLLTLNFNLNWSTENSAKITGRTNRRRRHLASPRDATVFGTPPPTEFPRRFAERRSFWSVKKLFYPRVEKFGEKIGDKFIIKGGEAARSRERREEAAPAANPNLCVLKTMSASGRGGRGSGSGGRGDGKLERQVGSVEEYAITFPGDRRKEGRKDKRKRKALRKRRQRELDGKLQVDVAGFEWWSEEERKRRNW